MKKNWMVLALAAVMTTTACTSNSNAKSTDSTNYSASNLSENTKTATQETNQSGSEQTKSKVVSTATAITTEKYSARDSDPSWNEQTATKIEVSNGEAKVSGKGASYKDGVLTVSAAGTYVFSGTSGNFQIVVSAAKTDKVQLVLNGVNLTNKTGSVLDIKTADKVFLTLNEGSKNTFIDGASYKDTADGSPDATVFSKSDLTINGSGALTVKANYKDAVKSKDELTITGGNITVNAKEDALTGKDSLAIKDGTFVIQAGKDGLKASNDTDAQKGWISIDGGKFTIQAGNDAVQSETLLEVNGGTFDIKSGGGAEALSAASKNKGQNGAPNQNMMPGGGQNAPQPPEGGTPPNGQRPPDEGRPGRPPKGQRSSDGQGNGSQNQNMTPGGGQNAPQSPSGQPSSNGDGTQQQQKPSKKGNASSTTGTKNEGTGSGKNGMKKNQNNSPTTQGQTDSKTKQSSNQSASNQSTSNKESKKGLKSGGNLVINNGTFVINSEDDTIHSNQSAYINGGTMKLSSGDDGIHAEEDLIIKGNSNVLIEKSEEGLEGKRVKVEDGKVTLSSADDGINATDGSSSGNGDERQEGVAVEISGGTVTVYAEGDGVDSNGDLIVSGGQTVIYGPSSGGNGMLDYNGSATIKSGTFAAVGTSDMFQGFAGTQKSIVWFFNSRQSSTEALAITDESGKTLYTLSPKTQYQAVFFSSENLKEGKTYTLKRGGQTVSQITVLGSESRQTVQ